MKSLVVTLVVCCATPAFANVSMKNGNFFVGYTDIEYVGGLEPKIERVYNSKSSHDGWFGFGWGSDYETYLDVSGDGTVVVHENGGGAYNIFAQQGHPTQPEIDGAIDKMITARGLREEEVRLFRRNMSEDARERGETWRDLVRAKKLVPHKIAEGTTLVSDKFSHQVIVKTKDGFERRFDDHRVQTFNNDGWLLRVADANGHHIALTRDPKHPRRVTLLEDDFGRRLRFTHDKNGYVTSITGEMKGARETKKASYKYNANSELIYSKDAAGIVNEFAYDKRGRHNLVEIRYSDKTSKHISYHSMDMGEQVAVLRDRDETTRAYSYFTAGLRDFTAVEETDAQGAMISTQRYEYVRAFTSSGVEYTERIISDVDGDRTDTTYHETCNLPTTIVRNGETSKFQYDPNCHITRKETPTELTVLTYDPTANKVSRVEKTAGNSKSWATYTYDARANLTGAKDSAGNEVNLEYDDAGRISVLRSVKPEPQVIRFTYNRYAKPTVIEVEGVGALNVTYNAAGDIQKVDSDGGRQAALKVTSTFQSLLDIIRPAGVTVSF